MAQNKAAADSTEMGVHPYKETANLAWETTGFSLLFHGGVNFWLGDYPTDEGRFTNFGYPTAGLNLEYNFTPMWGIGLGYSFAMPQVKYSGDALGAFRNTDGSALSVPKGDLMYRGQMHRGQVYLTFDLINAWFPRAWTDVFSLNVFAGFGGALYKNSVSFNDFQSINPDGTHSDSGKYVKDADNDKTHTDWQTVAFVPVGVAVEFNVSRQIALGVRAQYDLFLNDYVDNRYQDKANKNNDGMLDVELSLRWKIAAKKKNHMMNVSSHDVLEEKYYQSHPHRRKRPHVVDTVVVYHRDTIVVIHRDTIVMGQPQPAAVTEAPVPVVVKEEPVKQGRCDLELYPGWESEADAVVVEGQSLSRLARKYYNNTFCWVYLWIANRTIAPDPNLILPKCVLKVPKLNDCQLSITKEEAKEMAARYRGE